jgi:hypothetical protein
MNRVRGALGGLAILAATVGGVAAIAFGLGAWITPAASLAEPTPTPAPSFDLAVAPDAAGGSLEISGHRSGTMTLNAATGVGGRYELQEDGSVMIRDANAPIELSGPSGHVRFDRDSGEVTHIAYDGLSIFLDAGECAISHGAVDEATGLMAALVECPDIADVRGQGVISVEGIVALPAEALLGRGDLPSTGGSIELDGGTITLQEADIFLDGQPIEETGRIQWGTFDADTGAGILLEYDPAADRFFLGGAFSAGTSAALEDACPIATEELGRLNEHTTVVRLDIDCTDVAVEGGGATTVTGSIVADVIQGYTEAQAAP